MSLPETQNQNPDLERVPEWAHFFVQRQALMEQTIAKQATEIKVQAGKLKLFQRLIDETDSLKAQLTEAKEQLKKLEQQ